MKLTVDAHAHFCVIWLTHTHTLTLSTQYNMTKTLSFCLRLLRMIFSFLLLLQCVCVRVLTEILLTCLHITIIRTQSHHMPTHVYTVNLHILLER